MGLEALESRISHGDQEAFKEWMDVHIRTIERFAIQYGASLELAGTVAETIFRNIYESFEDVAEVDLKESALIRTALEELDGRQNVEPSGGFFSFEEDDELHHRVVGMPKEYRVPFILNQFHKKTATQIAEITGETEQHVEQSLTQARSLLDEPNLEKKLEFLNRSYERLSPTYNEMNIFHRKVEEPPPIEKEKETDKKKPYLFWGIGAGILLVFVSIITYTNSDAYQLKSAEKFTEMAEVSFQEELERNLRLAGLPAPEIIRSDIYAETYGEDTRRKFDRFITGLKNQVETDGRIDKINAKTELNTLIHELMVPSEMVANVSEKPLVNDQEKSMEFVNEYIEKMNTLLRSYMHIFAQNQSLLRESGRNDEGSYDVEAFYAKKSDYPEAFQHALDGMEAQGFVLRNDMSMPTEYVYVYPNIGTPDLSKVLRENLHSDTSIYLSIIMGDLFDIHDRSIEKQTDLLSQLEIGLLQAENYQELHAVAFTAYISVIYSSTGMAGYEEIRDSTGTIKEEYKEAWTRIAFNGGNSPAGQMMRQVIIEMEDSGWTTSAYLDRLEYFFIEGELRRIMGEMKK